MENTNLNLNVDHLVVSEAPHIRTKNTVQKEMLRVIIALIPALIASVYFFGYRALLLTGISVLSCVIAEYLYQRITNQEIRIYDLSAVVTGILLAYNVPVSLPIPMLVIGAFFAIIIVKQLFGGLGANFMNPALAARAFLMASWSSHMTNFTLPKTDMVTAPTFLSGAAGEGINITLMDAFLGNMGGSLGEVSALALLIGAAYLIYKKVISVRIPFTYIITTAVVLVLCGIPISDLPMQLLSGGLILGAFFMATDFVTVPVTRKGQVVFAMGCGIFTALIRAFGALPEGVSYAILVMNCFSPLIEKFTTPKAYGRGGKE